MIPYKKARLQILLSGSIIRLLTSGLRIFCRSGLRSISGVKNPDGIKADRRWEKGSYIMKRENFGSRLGFLLVSAGQRDRNRKRMGGSRMWRDRTAAEYSSCFYRAVFTLYGRSGPLQRNLRLVVRDERVLSVLTRHLKSREAVACTRMFVMIGCYLLMMYYTTVSGWMLSYFVKFATGTFTGMDADQVQSILGKCSAIRRDGSLDGSKQSLRIFYLQQGLRTDLKRSQMDDGSSARPDPCAGGHSLILPGAKEGLSFYLLRILSVRRTSDSAP